MLLVGDFSNATYRNMDMDKTFALEVNGREVNDKGCFVDTGEMVKI